MARRERGVYAFLQKPSEMRLMPAKFRLLMEQVWTRRSAVVGVIPGLASTLRTLLPLACSVRQSVSLSTLAWNISKKSSVLSAGVVRSVSARRRWWIRSDTSPRSQVRNLGRRYSFTILPLLTSRTGCITCLCLLYGCDTPIFGVSVQGRTLSMSTA